MIFIITHKGDFTADFVIEKLNQKNINYYRFNCEDIDKKGYSFQLDKKNNFRINKIQIGKIKSVWFRRTKLPSIDINSYEYKLYLLGEYNSLLTNIYNLIEAKRWMSRPRYVYEAENKMLQLKIASQIGFQIPETVVTSEKKILQEFANKHKYKLIIKPLNQGRINEINNVRSIFTNKLKKEHIDKIDQFTLTPSIFQPYIEKEYELRITVVKNKVFAAKIDSQKDQKTMVDWRKHKLKFSKYILPEDLVLKCLKLVKKLNLSFGAIDIIKSKNGEYIFLEINPNGQWAWIEFDTGLLISDEIIKFLYNPI